MSQKKIEAFVEWAKGRGWEVADAPRRQTQFPQELTRRYQLPRDYLEFLQTVGLCASPMGTEWFLCEENYQEDDDAMFHWDEYERLSLAAAQDLGDEFQERSIRAFWDGVLPFFMAVGNGYEYYGFDLTGQRGPKGSVLHGWEPEFEEAEVAAPDLDSFLDLLMGGKIPLGGVLFDPEEYEFMETAGRAQQERLEKESALALEALLHPQKEEAAPEDEEECGCGHHHGGDHHEL